MVKVKLVYLLQVNNVYEYEVEAEAETDNSESEDVHIVPGEIGRLWAENNPEASQSLITQSIFVSGNVELIPHKVIIEK